MLRTADLKAVASERSKGTASGDFITNTTQHYKSRFLIKILMCTGHSITDNLLAVQNGPVTIHFTVCHYLQEICS